MSLEDDVVSLSKLEFFQDFTEDQLRLVAFGAQRKRLRDGEELFGKGDLADGGYVVTDGEIILTGFKGERKQELGRFSRGSLVGELALVSRNRRPATGIANGDTEVLRISRAVVRRVMEEYPEIAAKLHDRLSDSIVETMDGIASVQNRFLTD